MKVTVNDEKIERSYPYVAVSKRSNYVYLVTNEYPKANNAVNLRTGANCTLDAGDIHRFDYPTSVTLEV